MSFRSLLLAGACLFAALPAGAQTIYPIDNAAILTGALFDLKVEFPGLAAASALKVTVNGVDHAQALGKAAAFIEKEDGKDQSALMLRDVAITAPGRYLVRATDGTRTQEVTWEVYDTPGPQKAKNVILFIGDGMTLAHRTAARMLAKGISEGKYHGRLSFDQFPNTALVSTAGAESIVTDSANSAHAYTTGHKSSNNALGVYASRSAGNLDHPKVETLATLVKRNRNMAVGVVTNTEIEDATPASMVAHTRRRGDYDAIVQMFLDVKPDVMMGGGSANFLPKSTPGSRRADEIDYIAKFKEAGYAVATDAAELKAAGAAGPAKLLGLFNLGNMDGVLDRRFLKGGSVKRFPNQPDLTDQVKVALQLLSRNENGFMLMVESGLIDKYTHRLDMERAVYDTILLDNAVKAAQEWVGDRNDTLIIVVADHSHPIGIVGTVDDDMKGPAPTAPLRDKVGIYDKAGFPNYPKPDADGYPDKVDVSRRLAIFSAGHPDYYETFRPKLDNPNTPATPGAERNSYVPNEAYAKEPGALLITGTLPKTADSDVHSAEDVILSAIGPGAEQFRGSIDNTDVFRFIAQALALGQKK